MANEIEEPTFEVRLPLYIFSGNDILHIGEGCITKTKEYYHGAFDFDVSREPVLKEMEYLLYLVHGPKAERIPIGNVLFNYHGNRYEFFGCFELKATPKINLAMDTPRSLTNREY